MGRMRAKTICFPVLVGLGIVGFLTYHLMYYAPLAHAGGYREGGGRNRQAAAVTTESVSAGGLHTCGLNKNAEVHCWGFDATGQATEPTGSFLQVSSGGYHACGVKSDNTIDCWGSNSNGQASDPSGTYLQVSTGQYHNCAIKLDGSVECWGAGTSNTGDPNLGQALPPSGTFKQVSAGDYHTCGVKSDGSIECWGDNAAGQSTNPTGTFTQVTAGSSFTCGVRTDSTVLCWGDNTDGQATEPTGRFIQVSGNGFHACGLKTDNTIDCWGNNSDGRAADPSGTFQQVSTGDYHTCGIKTDGTTACWGRNDYGQISALILSPSSLPNGVVNSNYSETLIASGGSDNYVFGLLFGDLPPGLSMASDGTLSGIPSSVGTYNFTVYTSDTNGIPGQHVYSITVDTPTQTPTETATPTATDTPTQTGTSTVTETPAETGTATSTATKTSTPSTTPTADPCTLPPRARRLQQPKNGAKFIQQRVHLNWNDGKCPAKYNVVVRRNSSSGRVEDGKEKLKRSEYTTQPLTKGLTYFWNVTICTKGGCTPSKYGKFTILAPTPTPTRTPTLKPTNTPRATNTPRPTSTQQSQPTQTPTDVAPNCDPSYPDFCIPPPPPDLDCNDAPIQGHHNFTVLPPDPHNLDADHDGLGCEG